MIRLDVVKFSVGKVHKFYVVENEEKLRGFEKIQEVLGSTLLDGTLDWVGFKVRCYGEYFTEADLMFKDVRVIEDEGLKEGLKIASEVRSLCALEEDDVEMNYVDLPRTIEVGEDEESRLEQMEEEDAEYAEEQMNYFNTTCNEERDQKLKEWRDWMKAIETPLFKFSDIAQEAMLEEMDRCLDEVKECDVSTAEGEKMKRRLVRLVNWIVKYRDPSVRKVGFWEKELKSEIKQTIVQRVNRIKQVKKRKKRKRSPDDEENEFEPVKKRQK